MLVRGISRRCAGQRQTKHPASPFVVAVALSLLLMGLAAAPALAGFTAQQTYNVGSKPNRMAIRDLNNDGRPDVVVVNQNASTISVLLGDVNGDGKQDLIVASTGGTTVNVLLGNGDSTFQPFQSFTVGSHPSAVGVAEINGNAFPDIIAANRDSDTISVLLGTAISSIQFTSATFNVAESASSTTIKLTRTGDLSGPATVVVRRVSGGSALINEDYTWSDDIPLTWGDGEGGTQDALLTLLPDTRDEPDETVFFAVSLPTGATWATLGAQSSAIVTIADDDPPTVRANAASIAEGNSGTRTLSMPVVLSAASNKTVTVQYATSNGSASGDSDYVPVSDTLTFEPGTTSLNVNISVNGDTVVEPDETLTLTLSAPTNATLGTASATGTITNDDVPLPPSPCSPRPRVNVASTRLPDGRLQVTLTAGNGSLQSIRFATGTRALQNASVQIDAQTITGATTVTLPANTTSKTFTISRVAAGQVMTVPLIVTDGCGAWETFVGLGAGS